MKEKFSAVILAAGYSGRMGRPKALLDFDGNRCFVQKIADEFFTFGCTQVILVTNQMVIDEIKDNHINLDGIDIVLNPNPEYGRLYSLYIAMQKVPTDRFAFMANADNPFISQVVLKELWHNKWNADYVCPSFRGKGGHPALISPTIIGKLKLENDIHQNLKEYLNGFSKQYVDVEDDKILVNINTPEDYNRLLTCL